MYYWDLLWGLFLVVLSPASLIVIIIVELIDSGFFKKKFINYGIRKRNLSYHQGYS